MHLYVSKYYFAIFSGWNLNESIYSDKRIKALQSQYSQFKLSTEMTFGVNDYIKR